MTSGSASAAWSQSGARNNRSETPSARMRQSTSSSVSPTYPMGHQQFPANSYVGPLVELQPGSSNSHLTSSLSGAIGDTSVPSSSRHSRSPSMLSENTYASGGWQSMYQHPGYPGVAGMTFGAQDVDATNLNYDFTTHRGLSPGSYSNSSGSSTLCDNSMYGSDQYSGRHDYLLVNHDVQPSSSGDESLKAEVSRLRQQLRELKGRYGSLEAKYEASKRGLPPPSPAFLESWEKRTQIRKQIYCSPNRAGNTLCSWHDSRRERRSYPPRGAPPGYLNCGCTIEEALFEESLARHNVGSYHPGESVRMDPALRNPLLQLLKQRYGYQDGDFERDSKTGGWIGDEGDALWHRKATAGSVSRRQRVDTERH